VLVFVANVGFAVQVTVVDDAGGRIVLDHPARRIVSLAPHITELLFAAGAGPSVVGVSAFSDVPKQALELPRVSSGSGIDVERVLRLHADLVVAWESGNSAAQVAQLEALGLRVFRSEPRAIDDIATTLERLGELAGASAVAETAAKSFRADVAKLRADYAGRTPVSVVYEIGEQPLMTVNGEHIISHWLDLCGARNLFAGLPLLVPVVDMEAAVAANPRAIIADWYTGRTDAWRARWRHFPFLDAVRHDRFIVVSDESLDRATPRAVHAARVLCESIDKVRDADSVR